LLLKRLKIGFKKKSSDKLMVRGELVDKSTNFQIRNFGKDTLLFLWFYENTCFFGSMPSTLHLCPRQGGNSFSL